MDAAPELARAPETHFELPYSRLRIFLGFFAAVLVSFILSYELMMTSGPVFGSFQAGLLPSIDVFISPLAFLFYPFGLTVFGIVGLPVAGIVVAMIGVPTWQFFASRGHTTYEQAAKAGAIAGGIIVIVEFCALLPAMVATHLGANGADYMPLSMGGSRLTAGLAWLKLFTDGFFTIGIGAVSGLAARLGSGPARG